MGPWQLAVRTVFNNGGVLYFERNGKWERIGDEDPVRACSHFKPDWRFDSKCILRTFFNFFNLSTNNFYGAKVFKICGAKISCGYFVK